MLRTPTTGVTVGLIGILVLGFASSASATTTPTTTRVSVDSDGYQGLDGDSRGVAISADGRYIAFDSLASDLVLHDTNRYRDVFLHDTETATTTRISVASDGTEGDNESFSPTISADGRYIAFESYATNLAPDAANAYRHIFLHDTESATTTRISVATDGTQANDSSFSPTISGNGRYIAFESYASNLAADDANNALDVFLHDTKNATTTRISVATDGTEGTASSYAPAISSDGRHITFLSDASDLVPGDGNDATDVFLHTTATDTTTATTTRISVATDGTEGDSDSYQAAISPDGRYITFISDASNLVPGDTNAAQDLFLHDTATATTTRVSVAADGTQVDDGDYFSPVISADGRYIAFGSFSAELVPDDTNDAADIFLRETATGTITRISVASDTTQGNDDSYDPVISANGRHIAFESHASNLVPGDTNNMMDVFLHRLPDLAPASPAPGAELAATGHDAGALPLVALTALAVGIAALGATLAVRAPRRGLSRAASPS